MIERSNVTKMKGNPVTLVGDEVKVGEPAPHFTVVDNALKPVSLSSFLGKKIVLISVPSLDTPVCDTEVRRFNKEATKFDKNTVVLTLSMDLPFAQKRWCGNAEIDRVITLSDHRDAVFGLSYGVLIKDLRLLARSVFVIDREGIVRYTEIVPEITAEPNYDEALKQLKALH